MILFSSMGIVVALLLAVPLVRAVERNALALQIQPLGSRVIWTDPVQMCAPSPPPPVLDAACDKEGDCFLNALSALRRGEWESARRHTRTSADALAILIHGWGAWCGGDHSAAIVAWQRAAKPLGEKFLADGEQALSQAGGASRALAAGEIAQALMPSAKTHYLLARTHDALGNVENARQQFFAALELEQQDAELYWALADLEWRLDDLTNARAYLERALALNARQWLYWHRYGEILLRSRDAVGAERAFARAVELNPTFGFAHAGVFSAQLAQGRLDAAHSSLLLTLKYLESAKHKAGYLGAFANVLARQGDFENAAEYYRQAVEFDPTHDSFQMSLIRAYTQAGACEDAARAYAAYKNILAAQNKTPAPLPPCAQQP